MQIETIISVLQFVCGIVVMPIIVWCFVTSNRITKIETNIEWILIALKVSGDNAGHILHSPHSPDFDILIEKFWHGQLTRNDELLLAQKLDQIIREDKQNPIYAGQPYSDGQKSAAAALLGVLTATSKITENKTNK